MQQQSDKQIVKKIVKVDYAIEESNPPNLVVTVVGQVPTAGYTNVELVRVIYVTQPADGIQDYILFAVPPTDPVPQVISEVKATNTWKGYREEVLKGIRIHGTDDGVAVMAIKDTNVQTKEAILSWEGEYAADGCGFFIEIDNKKYKPENEDVINNQFKTTENIKVKIRFKYLNRPIKYNCGLSSHETDGIKVLSIEKI